MIASLPALTQSSCAAPSDPLLIAPAAVTVQTTLMPQLRVYLQASR